MIPVSLRASQSPQPSDTSSILEDTSGSEQGSECGDCMASVAAGLYGRMDAFEERAQREREEMMTMIVNPQREVSKVEECSFACLTKPSAA